MAEQKPDEVEIIVEGNSNRAMMVFPEGSILRKGKRKVSATELLQLLESGEVSGQELDDSGQELGAICEDFTVCKTYTPK